MGQLPADVLTAASAGLEGPAREVLVAVLRVTVAGIWLAAGAAKLRDLHGSAAAARQLVAKVSLPAIALLAAGEIAGGLLVLALPRHPAPLLVSAAAFLVMAGLVGAAVLRGAGLDSGCGCFGPRRSASGPARSAPAAVARNLTFAAVAAAAVWGA